MPADPGRRRARRSAEPEAPCRYRRHADGACRIRWIHRRRNHEMGEGDQVHRRQDQL